MYQRFLEDPDSVDPAWHEFFADYRPGDASPTSGTAAQTAADTTAAPSPLTPIAKPGRERPRAGRRRVHHPARCGVAGGQEHERLAHRAHGHERARRACEAARRQ